MKIPNTRELALATGKAVGSAEDTAIGLVTHSVYRFRVRHPLIYGLIAFVLGGGFAGLFTMSTYRNWAFEGINLNAAFHQVIFGSLGGGILLVILAFAYASAIAPALAPMAADGIAAPGVLPAVPPRSLQSF